MFKESHVFRYSDIAQQLTNYQKIVLGFYADHRLFECGFQPGSWVKICTAGWFPSGDTYATDFHLDNLAYKASIGEELKTPLVPMSTVVTSSQLKYRMPKKPQWHPRRFSQKPPVARSKFLSYVNGHLSIDSTKFSRRSSNAYKRDLEASKAAYASFSRKLNLFEKRKQLFMLREQERRKTYLVRLGKYNLRMARYTEAAERLQRKLSRPLRVGRYGYPQHRYIESNLAMEPGSRATLGLWWNAGSPTLINWAYARFSDVFTTETYMTSDNIRLLCKATTESIGASLMRELTARDFGLTRKLYAKISDQKLHVGNLIGESHQTLNLLVTTYKRLADLCLLKKGLLKGITQTMLNKKKLSNEFLQFKFGAEPLVKDLIKLMEDYSSSSTVNPTLVSFKVATSQKPKPVQIECEHLQFTGVFRLSYLAFFRVGDDYLRDLEQFGLIDPAQVFYEITPWSFVVDWLLPVGQWITSLRSTEGLEFLGLTQSLQTTGVYDLRTPLNAGHDSFPIMDSPLGVTGRFHGRLNLREVNQPLPDRNLILRAKNPYSLSHFLEATALTIQRLKR